MYILLWQSWLEHKQWIFDLHECTGGNRFWQSCARLLATSSPPTGPLQSPEVTSLVWKQTRSPAKKNFHKIFQCLLLCPCKFSPRLQLLLPRLLGDVVCWQNGTFTLPSLRHKARTFPEDLRYSLKGSGRKERNKRKPKPSKTIEQIFPRLINNRLGWGIVIVCTMHLRSTV